MTDGSGNLETWLAVLGKADRAGALRNDARPYPWRNATLRLAEPARRRFSWIRVGFPIAAAAAVAVLFVGPALWPPPDPGPIAGVIPNPLESTESAVTTVASNDAEGMDCDYNRDGVVNGADIQAFIDLKISGGAGASELEKEQFQRCLLGLL